VNEDFEVGSIILYKTFGVGSQIVYENFEHLRYFGPKLACFPKLSSYRNNLI